MAWSMPNPGQWNPGIAMTPDMNMGSYTPEQWALMQQQNWHQWSQWQQQYAQWQNQYGGEYAQQMQAMSGMQPASGAVPPPVPPPDKPPPPPPHENDQPLYGSSAAQSNTGTTSNTHQSNQIGYNNNNTKTGNNQNWSYTDMHTDKPSNQGVNTEALRVLAEEEKSFDIQFQKWEEEIEKWKKENVNHPDRQAYREYEQKFEACRAQLLERRQQMKIKRDNLMGNVQPASNTTQTGNNNTKSFSTPLNTTVTNNYTPSTESHVQNKTMNVQVQPNKKPPQYEQFNNPAHQEYNRKDDIVVDPQDRYNSYKDLESEYTSTPPVKTTFIPSSNTRDIPGLDLVPAVEKSTPAIDTIDITDSATKPSSQQQNTATPDYSKISKGINNILGDEKIMNILSMMSNQKQPNTNEGNQSGPYQQSGNMMQPNQWNTNNSDNYSNNQQQNMNQQNMPYRQQMNYKNQQQEQHSNFPDRDYQKYDGQYGDNSNNNHNIYDRQNQFGNPNMPPRGVPQFRPNVPPPRPNIPPPRPNIPIQRPNMSVPRPNMPLQRPNMPPPRPLLQNLPSQPISNDYSHGAFERQEIHQPNPINQPKWIDEPLFTPSIIVEYEHKPLRLKARDFIEPVHMFDYNHKSKNDGDNSKKDFEREVDDLFSRKPRNADSDMLSSDRLYSRDYDRRSSRDDFKERDRHDFYDRRVNDRRYEDLDRIKRQDYERRDRGGDYDRLRDTGFNRDRDMGRDRDFDRARDVDRERDIERDRERDLRRDRDLGRDRDFGRDRDAGRGREFGRDRDVKDRDNGRDRNLGRDPIRDRLERRDMNWDRNRSHESDSRKRDHSSEKSNDSFSSKKTKSSKEVTAEPATHVIMIDDILESPGREIRPEKIVIILRGLPGSGKSYLAKLIRGKEAEHDVKVRIMSIDDYFTHEGEIEEKDLNTGKIIKKPHLKYEYDESMEENYITSLKRAFKRALTDGFFSFIIYDAINDQLKSYADIWNYARQNGFQVYVCTMEMDVQTCFKRNIHGRSLEDIEVIKSRFFPTPAHHLQLDATTLLQNASIQEVQMEDVEDVTMEDADVVEVDSSFTSKWEKMDDAAQLARLDGTSKPLRPSQLSMEDYLQLDDWKPNVAKPGKKTVRWADLEERRQQEKMRAIGFVVGQTDWHRMTDPTMGSSALTQTKYIERVRRF